MWLQPFPWPDTFKLCPDKAQPLMSWLTGSRMKRHVQKPEEKLFHELNGRFASVRAHAGR